MSASEIVQKTNCKLIKLMETENTNHKQHLKEVKTLAEVSSCEFCVISKNTVFTEHLWTTASKRLHLCTKVD